jgi:ABC-type microcin C transport system permease subunit YejB
LAKNPHVTVASMIRLDWILAVVLAAAGIAVALYLSIFGLLLLMPLAIVVARSRGLSMLDIVRAGIIVALAILAFVGIVFLIVWWGGGEVR